MLEYGVTRLGSAIGMWGKRVHCRGVETRLKFGSRLSANVNRRVIEGEARMGLLQLPSSTRLPSFGVRQGFGRERGLG